MNSEKLFEYFIIGITVMTGLYEICRSGKKSKKR